MPIYKIQTCQIIKYSLYVDKETLTGRYLYTGIFKYTNLLGLTKTVWKFKEIPIPSEDFYFISK